MEYSEIDQPFSNPYTQLGGDDITYRERIHIAKLEVFSTVIHENIAIPNRIRRDGDDVVYYFKNRPTIDKMRKLSRTDKIDILEQIYNLSLFLEANNYQLTELSLCNIGYDDKIVTVHNLQVDHSNKPNNDKIINRLWKELGRPIMMWKLTEGRKMKRSFILDNEEITEFLERFRLD